MSKSTQFWDKQAPSYAARPISDQAGYEASLERVRAYLNRDDQVLELGCGSGMTARLLAPTVAHIHATDISPGMIAIAKEKAAEEGCTGVTFGVATVEEVARPERGYDVILAFNFLHLVEDLPQVLRSIHALLKPGGKLICKTPCISGKFRAFWPVIKVMQLLGKAPYVRFAAPNTLDAAIEAASLRIEVSEDFKGSSMRHFVLAQKA